MYSLVDMKLLADKLENLSKAPYFDRSIENHADALVNVINHVNEERSLYNDETRRILVNKIWTCYGYLLGSTMNESPYEIKYCLIHALRDWCPDEKYTIATALIDDESNFYISLIEEDPWEFISKALVHYNGDIPDDKLILMSLPRLYNQSPLYCIPLYHELGHFVDNKNKISELTFLFNPINSNYQDPILIKWESEVHLAHRMEHFADLFASCYVGDALIKSFNAMELNSVSKPTHPATIKRKAIMQDFLDGKQTTATIMFENALKLRNCKSLYKRYEIPQVKDAFDDIYPYKITSIKELHGIFAAGWSYLEESNISTDAEDTSRIVNNMVGKSIRNYVTYELWKGKKND